MRKIFILFSMCLLLTSSVVFAKDFSNDERWYWAYSSSDYTGYVDTKTLKYDPETDTAEIWVRWEFPNKNCTMIYQSKIFYYNGKMSTSNITVYPYGSDIGKTYENPNSSPYTPTPASGDEKVMEVVAGLVDRDNKLKKLEENKKEAEEQKQKEIEEKAKAEKETNEQAKQEQKEKNIINTGISILGSIWR